MNNKETHLQQQLRRELEALNEEPARPYYFLRLVSVLDAVDAPAHRPQHEQRHHSKGETTCLAALAAHARAGGERIPLGAHFAQRADVVKRADVGGVRWRRARGLVVAMQDVSAGVARAPVTGQERHGLEREAELLA